MREARYKRMTYIDDLIDKVQNRQSKPILLERTVVTRGEGCYRKRHKEGCWQYSVS